ncbi:hypothetical protein [Arthrobacter wenxiniae]|jgi:hypothetical protein|uniref:Uncharacterized protein n=1 Tax=Arthrobacter wenxiniae TaxID=2713570 RepID=A0A7Y7IGC1_9MICC|nr:hypothetical protein [Arthrobacter wenxiniae]NVM94985.1 hypothetical protein [Arthrobacter wenxiniae]
MNSVWRQAPGDGGFVSVDDGGEFSFHESAADVVAAFEYANEAACILDRHGAPFRLVAAPGARLALAPGLGAPDFSWLRQAWIDAQHRAPHRYPLQRFYPGTMPALLETLFECLWLRHGPDPWPPPSAVSQGAILADPFGHVYRAAEVPTLRKSVRTMVAHTRPGAGLHARHPIFVEVEAESGTRGGHAGQASVPGRPTVTGIPAPGVAGS